MPGIGLCIPDARQDLEGPKHESPRHEQQREGVQLWRRDAARSTRRLQPPLTATTLTAER